MANNRVIEKIQLHLVSPTKYDWGDVAAAITKGCYLPYDKAKAIYCWLAKNISYDTTYQIHDADTAWKKKKGVCQAYCELFYRIGIAAGLDVRIITGHGRGKAQLSKVIEDHCWIVVNKDPYPAKPYPFPESIIYLKGHEEDANITITKGLSSKTAILIEPTWGAGEVDNGKFVQHKDDMSWFDVNPCWMIFTHYPSNPADQLLGEYALSPSDYKKLPYLNPGYAEYGFEGSDILSYFLQTGSTDFPVLYPNFGKYIDVMDMPIQSTLYRGNQYTIIISKKQGCNVAIVNENQFLLDDDRNTQWKETPTSSKITFIPNHKGTLSLSIRDNKEKNIYHSIIEYIIK